MYLACAEHIKQAIDEFVDQYVASPDLIRIEVEDAETAQLHKVEAARLGVLIKPGTNLIVLDLMGRQQTSLQLAARLESLTTAGKSHHDVARKPLRSRMAAWVYHLVCSGKQTCAFPFRP
ncbi:MAG: hypothetical protein DDT30_01526 [Dehalococcoidia bacterium]|nr:hypothetical protein [Bacillota bacterium]